MSKPLNPNRQTVVLQPSKIRREPPPELRALKQTVLPDDSEREAWTVVVGILAFALAITFLILWISDYTSPGTAQQPRAITIGDVS
jgi:hypothetical protein